VPNKALFCVVGTDTEVGKTCAATGLSRAFIHLGLDAIAVKPVETGCEMIPQAEQDGARLARATGQQIPTAALRRFRQPLAAPLAAERDGEEIDFDALVEMTRDAVAHAHVGLVEGAGGLLSPITWSKTMVDLTRALHGRAVLVAADRLGTLNHVCLALSVLAAEHIDVAAVILSQVNAPRSQIPKTSGLVSGGPVDISVGSNLSSLRRIPGIPPVTYLPHVDTVEAAAGALYPLAKTLMGIENDGDEVD